MVDILKTFIKNTFLQGALYAVRGWLNKSIGQFTPSELYEAILEDRDLWVATPTEMRVQGQQFKKAYRKLFDKYMDEITTEKILEWIQEDHPELYSTLIQPGGISTQYPPGIIWIDKQVQKIKQKIMEM